MNFKRKLIVTLLAAIYIFSCSVLPFVQELSSLTAYAAEAVTVLTITGSAVNVRSGPDTSYSRIDSVSSGNSYTVLDSVTDSNGTVWYKISLGNQTGYVISTYCTVTTVTADTPTSAIASSATTVATKSTSATTDNKDIVMITGSVVSVRQSAAASGKRVAVVRRGETYTLISSSTDSSGKKWYKISVNGVQGYVCSDHAELTASISKYTASLTVIAPVVNLRSAAGTSSAKVGTAHKGDSFNVISSTTSDGVTWYKIKLGELTGYICGSYVKLTAAVTTTTTTTTTVVPTTTTTKAVNSGSNVKEVTTGVVTTSSTYLNVRSGAGTSYGLVGQINNGATVTILGKSNGWYKIEYSCTAGYGYVSADYITNVTTVSKLVSLAFGTEYYYVNQGSTVKLSASASGYTVTYSSEDADNAPVDASTGVVTGKTPGMYTITASSEGLTATAEVVVLKAPYTGIQHMTISDKGVEFIAQWEGGSRYDSSTDQYIFEPYKDSAGFWTIGYGHAKTTTESKSWSVTRAIAEFNKDISAMIGEDHILTDEKPYLTKDESLSLLQADLNDGVYVSAVSNWAIRNGVKLTQPQFDALVSFCYNLGASYWTSDTKQFYLKSAILCQRSGDDADPDDVIHGFTLYIKAGGQNLRGLWWRRRNEAEMFLEGDYAIDRENKFTLPDLVWGS